MERYDYLSYRIAKWFAKEKIASRFRKITNIIDDIDELEEETGAMYRNFKFKNIATIIANLPVFKNSINQISRTFGGGISDVNLMRKIAISIDKLEAGLEKINAKEDGAEKEFNGYKKDLKKIHSKIRKLT